MKDLIKRNKDIKEELNSYLEEKEKKYSLNNVGVFRLRVLSMFMKVTDEEEKEEIRNYMKSVVKKHK